MVSGAGRTCLGHLPKDGSRCEHLDSTEVVVGLERQVDKILGYEVNCGGA